MQLGFLAGRAVGSPRTPDGTWIQVEVQPQIDDRHWAKWYILDREQFERAWIPASGGIVYLIRPAVWDTPSLTQNNS